MPWSSGRVLEGPQIKVTSIRVKKLSVHPANEYLTLFRTGEGLGTSAPGMDKVREQGAPLPGNDKENWGNHHIDVIGYEEEEEKREKGQKEEEEKEEKKGKGEKR